MDLIIKINKSKNKDIESATINIPLEVLKKMGIYEKGSKLIAELLDNKLIIRNENNKTKSLERKKWIDVTMEEKRYLLSKKHIK